MPSLDQHLLVSLLNSLDERELEIGKNRLELLSVLPVDANVPGQNVRWPNDYEPIIKHNTRETYDVWENMVIPTVRNVVNQMENLNLTTGVINRQIKTKPVAETISMNKLDYSRGDLEQKIKEAIRIHNDEKRYWCNDHDEDSGCCKIRDKVAGNICYQMKNKINKICDELDFENGGSRQWQEKIVNKKIIPQRCLQDHNMKAKYFKVVDTFRNELQTYKDSI